MYHHVFTDQLAFLCLECGLIYFTYFGVKKRVFKI